MKASARWATNHVFDGVRRQVPGPTDARATTRAMARDPLGFLLEMTRCYGDVVRLPMTFGLTYLINHPDGIRTVLQDHATNYGKEPHENAIFTRIVGQSVLTTEGEAWLRLRRLEQPAFHRKQMGAVSGQMVEVTQTFLDGWCQQGADEQIDLVPAMTTLALHVLGRAIFSLDLRNDAATIAAALRVIGAYALELFYQPILPYLGPLAQSNRRGQAALRALDTVVRRLIQDRRTMIAAQTAATPDTVTHAGGLPDDILTLFLQLRDETGNAAFSDTQVRNETMSLLIAGHENVTSHLCWTWHLLAQHPDVAERLYAEVAEELGDRTPTLADLERLSYLHMVLEESLRLYPPAWSFSRRAVVDDSIEGYAIPKGATILLCPYTTHRHPAFWPDPERFDPLRFEAARQAERPRYTHFPFGGGQHQCMGATFAMLEAQLIMAMMVQQYRVTLAPGATVQPEALVTMRPRELRMIATPRRQ